MTSLFTNNPLLIVLSIWSLIWKGVALWKSSKYDQRNWFIALLVINTFGILELLYLFRFAKKSLTFDELKFWEKKDTSNRKI
jgi:hypothetical protein